MSGTSVKSTTEITRPTISIEHYGRPTLSATVIKMSTPGIIIPLELVNWIRTYPGVGQPLVDDGQIPGQTQFLSFRYIELTDKRNLSVLIKMICVYFGWERSQVRFVGRWTDSEGDIAYAEQVFEDVVLPLEERVLFLDPSLRYVVHGHVTLTQVGDDTIIQFESTSSQKSQKISDTPPPGICLT